MIEIKGINYNQIATFKDICKEKGLNFDKENTYYGLFKNGKLVSIASYKKIGNCVHFKSNYTLENERNKGYMTALIREIIKANNFDNMKVYCLKSSWGIYLRLGFELVDVKHHKYFDTFIMEKKK